MTMVKESSKIRDQNIENIIKGSEQKSEEELIKHIRDKMVGSQSRLE